MKKAYWIDGPAYKDGYEQGKKNAEKETVRRTLQTILESHKVDKCGLLTQRGFNLIKAKIEELSE